MRHLPRWAGHWEKVELQAAARSSSKSPYQVTELLADKWKNSQEIRLIKLSGSAETTCANKSRAEPLLIYSETISAFASYFPAD